MFSMHANLGLVAYALVRPATGRGGAGVGDTSELNSGVTANWYSTGICDVTLPGDPSQQEPLQEGQSRSPRRDLVLITPCDVGDTPISYAIEEKSDYTRRIYFSLSTTGMPFSPSFTILILRSLISPPVDASGNPLAPA